MGRNEWKLSIISRPFPFLTDGYFFSILDSVIIYIYIFYVNYSAASLCNYLRILFSTIFENQISSESYRDKSRASLREKRERERVRKFFSIENEDRLITDRERRSWTPILGTITPPPPPSPCGWFNEASRTSPKTLQLSDNVTMDRPVPILRLDIIGRGPTPACPRSMQRIR